MKKFLTKPLILTAVVALIFGAGIGVFAKTRSKQTLQFVHVTRMDIIETVSLTGRVQAKDSVNLGFEKSGSVSSIFAAVGDRVEMGKLLAVLLNADIRSSVLEGQANLEAEKSKLSALERGSRPEQIELEKLKVANARQNLADALMNLTAALDSSYTVVDDVTHNKIDQFFSNPRGTNPSVIFSVADSQLKTDIESGRFTLERTMEVWPKKIRDSLVTGDNEGAIAEVLRNVTASRDFLGSVSKAINSLLPSSPITQTVIDGWKADVSTSRSSVNSSLSSITSYAEKWRTARSNLALEEQQFSLMNAGSDPEDIAIQKAHVAGAEATLQKLESELRKTELRAPIAGLVSFKDLKVGETVTANQKVFGIIGDSAYEIEASVPETDIGRVTLRTPVVITLDAFPGAFFQGVVSEIDPAETIVDGVVSYKIKIAFTKPDERIKSGLTANLDIETRALKGVLSIPQIAIIETDEGASVKKKERSAVKEIKVTLGIRDREGNVEILSGLALNDEVEIVGLKTSK